MYFSPLNRFLITVVVFGLLLQGCRSSLQVTSEEPVLKKLRKTGDDVPIPDQVSVPDVLSSVVSGVPHNRLPTAASAMLPSVATSTVRVALPTHHLAVGPDTVSIQAQVSSTEPGETQETDTKPVAQVNANGAPIAPQTERGAALHGVSPHNVLAQHEVQVQEEHIRLNQALVALREGHDAFRQEVRALGRLREGYGAFMQEVRALLRELGGRDALVRELRALAGLPRRLGTLERSIQELERAMVLREAFGAEAWWQYFGEVGEEPFLPDNIAEIWNGPCPFWQRRKVKDTHLLVLIPATVNGAPFSLNLLGELVQRPRVGNYAAIEIEYDNNNDNNNDNVRRRFGDQSPTRSYWVLMTRDVLEGSRLRTYVEQREFVAEHAGRTGLPYKFPGALEAATAISLHYVRSGERLYAGDYSKNTLLAHTYTWCREQTSEDISVCVGDFEEGGELGVHTFSSDDVGETGEDSPYGVAGLRRLLPPHAEADTDTDTDTDAS